MIEKNQKIREDRAARASARDNVMSMLQPGETLVRLARVSNGIYWKSVAVLILALIVMTSVILFNLGVFLLLVAAIMATHAYLTKHYLILALTDKRVLVRQGILNLDTVQLRYNRIESVELEWSIPGRILSYSVVVMTGTGSRVAVVPFIADGPQFRKDLDERLYAEENRAERVVVVGQEADAPPSAPPEALPPA